MADTVGRLIRERARRRRRRGRAPFKAGTASVEFVTTKRPPEAWTQPLTAEQQKALDSLDRATEALQAAVAERLDEELTPEEVEDDEPLIRLAKQYHRAVRRVIHAGLAAHPRAFAVVRQWLAHPDREVPKGSRRALGLSKEHGPRGLPSLEDVLLAVEIQGILDKSRDDPSSRKSLDPADAAPIRRALVARLRTLARHGGRDVDGRQSVEMVGGAAAVKRLADRIDNLEESSWRERLAHLLDAEV